MDYTKNKTANDILTIAIERIRTSFADNVCSMILFGSYARGDFDKESDIDIALLVPCTRDEVAKYTPGIVDIASELIVEYGIMVSFVVIPKDEYAKRLSSLPFYQHIEREGVVLIA